ncbi:MAG: glutathione-disulfide reductase [Hyphomicrobiaceae bacterium]|nr:glutathione-disulfide reductase [Hyphomicrobiaceae bacterium]
MTTYDFDLFVIGAGSGGTRAARIAAGHGARVAVAEEYRFGGTCVIRGCVPKKLLVYASRFADDFADAAGFGWTLEDEPRFDWPALIAAKDREIARLEGLYRKGLEAAGVQLFEERATLIDAHTVALTSSGRRLTAEKILIATGGRPNTDPKLPGRELTINSNEAFDLKSLPNRIVVAGGGYIAVEFAGIFAGLGVDTTLIYRGDKILRGFDEDLRDGLIEAYRNRGVRFVFGTVFKSIEETRSGLIGHLASGATLEADAIMMAIGRSPNVEGLGLDAAGVACASNGAIVVDENSRTSVPSVFAVGDVCDRFNLTPVAIREGHAFADAQFGGRPVSVDYDMIPTAVFSTPEIGTVGLTEHAAVQACARVDVYKASFRPMRATLAGRNERTLMKLLVDGVTDRVVGCHILGPDAGEIVQMAAIALRMGATKTDFDRTMALHPSAAEELVTMRTKTATLTRG